VTGRPSFSVVIPTYNRAERLVGTLETVFSQEEPATEIIVVDNCSSDDTPAVMAELMTSHPNLLYVRHEENLERAASRNTGMARATADYVTFLDSDDLMYPSNLREAGDFVVETGAKFFHNLYESVDEAGHHLRYWPAPSLKNHLRALALGNFLSCIGVFIHRDIYQKHRFDTNPLLTGSEDWDFWLPVAAEHRIQRLPKVNSAIVRHPGQTVSNQEVNRAEERIEYILEKVGSDPKLRAAYGPYLRLMRSSLMIFLTGIANDNRLPRVAMRYLARALVAHPGMVVSPRFLRCFQLAIRNGLRR
jgi:glycosyltransferase involved in cell wall biosynthesis